MSEFIEIAIDKFTFRVATDRRYTAEGLWALAEGDHVRVGLSDFAQQRSGDVAFAEVKPAGTRLEAGEELATLETIKVNTVFTAPVAGTVAEVNPAMTDAPETINQDPYGAGWLAVLLPADWAADQSRLLDAPAYLKVIKGLAEAEAQ